MAKTSKPKADDFSGLQKKISDVLKATGHFEEQDFDPRTLEAFKASGGLFVKRWISGDKKVAAEIQVSVNAAKDCSVKLSYPITRPLKKDALQGAAANILLLSGNFLPGNLNVSPMGRLTLTYLDTLPTKNDDLIASTLAWRLTEGARIWSAARHEMGRFLGPQTSFDVEKDKIWQSQMGRPVKLSAEAMALVSGGSDGIKAWTIWGLAFGVGWIAKVAAVPLGPIGSTAAGGAGVKGTIDALEGIWDTPPPADCFTCNTVCSP